MAGLISSTWSQPPHDIHVSSHQVDIWRISLDLRADAVKLSESSLSADETQRAARFHFPAGRSRFILAHDGTRRILACYLHCEPQELSFSTGQFGKPALISNEGPEFNLAHSGDYALLAVARGHKVGVDVEYLRQDTELENIARRFFSEAEVAELMSLPSDQRPLGFYLCWTRKEAYIKAHGLGLSMPLDSFDVSLTPTQPAVLRATRPDPIIASRWIMQSLDVASGYASAVAVEDVAMMSSKGSNLEFRLWDWNPSPRLSQDRVNLP